MAGESSIQYTYPPNFSGVFSDHIHNGFKEYSVKCAFKASDTQGEAGAVKIRRSDLLTTNGNVPSKLAVVGLKGFVDGLSLKIHFNGGAEDIIARECNQQFDRCWRDTGGLVPSEVDDVLGDICVTTENVTADDEYDFEITVRAKD